MLTPVKDLQPLHRRLAHDYVQAMALGSLQPCERVPSVRALMRRHQVSLSTALQVLRHLEEASYLQAKPRVGTLCAARRAGMWGRTDQRA